MILRINIPLLGSIACALMTLIPFKKTEAQRDSSNKRPSVLVIITDDQRYNTIHALGNSEIVTPNMDRLVHDGTAFIEAHIMGGLSGAICCPSRAMIMTGKSLFHLEQGGKFVSEGISTFPELFKNNGYITFGTGKWHQDKACFNRSFTTGENILFGGMNPPATGGQYRPKLNHYDSTGKYEDPFWGDHFSSLYFADAAIDFLKQQKDSQQPFLMYVAFTSPHDPRTPPTWYGHSYRPDQVQLPASFRAEPAFDNGELYIRDELLLPYPRTEAGIKSELAKYYSMVSEVDYQIGRIIDELKKTGRYDNTIIVFAGDNGLSVGDHALLGKQNCYESAIRVPLIFAGPGIPKNKRVRQLVYLNDIFPTLCALTGQHVPSSVESRSLKAAFTDQPFKGRDHVFFAYLNIQRAIVQDRFKLICYNVKGQYRNELFDLKNDPDELHDLSGKSKYIAKVANLKNKLTRSLNKKGDPCNLDKPDWGHAKKWTSKDVDLLEPKKTNK
ncbi:sulfatase-like hydrolase/transferase [Arachidicoccus terrestris]|uniref:sulfatase-like hydrolase/transferase n=1 Tax=Arachidicoccus terrestris TaxID=2875539 RepID=UPI001CC67CB7|nr:sulfatase-like hydrolase/transferase [Arachidicoccus terrestris]UAY54182.1 sulfatase-like hydrolase/transferase [Arachidicoccus terrestris]